jgi:hypothetical protein
MESCRSVMKPSGYVRPKTRDTTIAMTTTSTIPIATRIV